MKRVAALVVVGVSLIALSGQADARPTQPARDVIEVAPDVQKSLQALDRLASYGYTVNTPARADRAIRHWQRANDLTVDGIVGPQTLASLGLDPPGGATATAPASRLPSVPPAPAAVDDVEGIIRDVWPDDLEDQALAIAHRESRLVPTARNACCYGLFQIYYTVHRTWLAELGITSAAELLDARTNTTAAYALYQRNGWAPWSL